MSGDIELLNFRAVVQNINDEKYDRVARLEGHETSNGTIHFMLDVNTDIWPVAVEEELVITLASSLNLDGSKDDGKGWRDANKGEATLADDYDYVCHGKIYRFEEGSDQDIRVYVSFGGLLLYLTGPFERLKSLRIDHVYLLAKK